MAVLGMVKHVDILERLLSIAGEENLIFYTIVGVPKFCLILFIHVCSYHKQRCIFPRESIVTRQVVRMTYTYYV